MSDQRIVLITGASSGFGALTARALADGGATVYAGMRATGTRNAPADDGSAKVSGTADRVRREFLTRVGLAGLLPARPAPTAQETP